jgi:hypothetical protein
MRGAGALVALVALVGLGGCALARRTVEVELERARLLRPPPALRCQDGDPVRVLVGRECPDGLCGWTCAGDRWRTP